MFKLIFSFSVANFDAKLGDTTCNQIYAELHNNMLYTYGASGTGARLGSLLGTLHDLNVFFLSFNNFKFYKK